MTKLPRVVEKRFDWNRTRKGKQLWGQWRSGHIRIDPRLQGVDYLDTLIHEAMHEFLPYLSEVETEEKANALARLLYRQGYRRTFL